MKPYEVAAYRKAIRLTESTIDILGTVKTNNWTQANALNDVYRNLEEILDALAEVAAFALPYGFKRRREGRT